MSGTSISFNSNSLQTSTIVTQSIEHEDSPEKTAQLYELAHDNLSAIPYINYPSKTITVSGFIQATSISALDTALDTFRGYLTGKNKNLDIGYGGGTRRYIATEKTTKIQRPGGLTWAEFEVEFICTRPFGLNTSTSSLLSATGRTSATYSDALTVLGTAPFQLPVVTLTYTALTPNATDTITIGNLATNQSMSVTATFVANDVVVFDSINKRVTINNISVDFSGAFIEFEPSSQTLTYSDTFDARTFNVSVVQYPMWL